MKNFAEYLKESQKIYSYRIKSVIEMSDDFMSSLESYLEKYHIVDIEPPKKTIIQSKPLDFLSIENSAVWMCDIHLRVPLVPTVFTTELSRFLGVNENYLLVKSFDDPVEVDKETLTVMQDVNQQAKEQDLLPKSIMSCSPEYIEKDNPPIDEVPFGDEYNKKFLTYLAQVAATRVDDKIDAPCPLFKWLDMPKEEPSIEDNFNDGINDVVKPVSWRSQKNIKTPVLPSQAVSVHGNYHSGSATAVVKNFIDPANGLDSKAIVIKKPRK